MSQVNFELMLIARASFFGRTRGGEHLDRSAQVILSRLELDGPLTISQLSDALGLDVSTLTRQTATMMRNGLIERVPDPDGGMARKYQMTQEGRSRLAALQAANVASLESVMDGWTPSEIEEFAQLLHRFNRGIERREGREWPRPTEPLDQSRP